MPIKLPNINNPLWKKLVEISGNEDKAELVYFRNGNKIPDEETAQKFLYGFYSFEKYLESWFKVLSKNDFQEFLDNEVENAEYDFMKVYIINKWRELADPEIKEFNEKTSELENEIKSIENRIKEIRKLTKKKIDKKKGLLEKKKIECQNHILKRNIRAREPSLFDEINE